MLSYHTDIPTDLPLLKQAVEAIRREESGGAVPDTDPPRVIYEARNRLYAIRTAQGEQVVKSFRIPIAIQRVVYSFFRPSKAARSYRNAIRLERCGIGTPRPAGYAIESEKGLLRRSYYVCESMHDCRDIRLSMQGVEGGGALLRALAGFIARMHRAGIHHIDLSPGNVLYRTDEKGEYSFYLIDLNRMKFYDKPIVGRKACANFARLSFCPPVSKRLAEYYAEAQGLNTNEVVEGVQSESDRFFRSKVRKYARKALVREQKRMSRSAFRQAYIRYRSVRLVRKLTGSTRLFRIENDLYFSFLEVGDLRHTLKRAEGYSSPKNIQ